MTKIAIIGYCQTVALLNAIGSWRPSLRQQLSNENTETNAASGWENINTNGRLFDIIPADGFSEFNDTKFCLLNTKAYPVARYIRENENKEVTLWYSDGFKQFLDSVAGFDVIVSLLNGSEIGTLSRMDVPDFDFFPYDDDDADRCPIDSVYIVYWAQSVIQLVQAGLTLMRHLLPHKRIIHVAPPPPLLENGRLDRQRPMLRKKLHGENLKQLREVTSGLNIQFLEGRLEAVGEDGFLKPEFDDGEARGNAEFGRLTAREIVKLI